MIFMNTLALHGIRMSIMSALLRGLIALDCHGSILKITLSRLIFIQFEASKREDLETGPFLFRVENKLYYEGE